MEGVANGEEDPAGLRLLRPGRRREPADHLFAASLPFETVEGSQTSPARLHVRFHDQIGLATAPFSLCGDEMVPERPGAGHRRHRPTEPVEQIRVTPEPSTRQQGRVGIEGGSGGDGRLGDVAYRVPDSQPGIPQWPEQG